MRNSRLTAALVATTALAGAGLAAQGGRAMTINDLLMAVRVADPQLSPDGQSVLYVRTSTEPGTFRRNADIYLTPTAQSANVNAVRSLITGERSENSPRWFPDGKSIAFISSRDGEPQIY